MKTPRLSRFIVTPVDRKAQKRRVGLSLQKDIRRQANRQILKACYTGVARSLSRLKDLRKFVASLSLLVASKRGSFNLREYKVGWKDVIIAFLFGVIVSMAHLAHAQTRITIKPPQPTIHKQKPITEPSVASQSKAEAVYVAPVYTPPTPVSTVVSGCGDNFYANFIYMHESGCRTNAVGPNGPCGLGQALPCSKMGCSLSDYACQNAFFTAYANSTYGGWAGSYAFWLTHSWW